MIAEQGRAASRPWSAAFVDQVTFLDRIAVMWNDIAGRLRALWEGPNRVLLAGVGGVFVLALLGLGILYAAHRPGYEVLFSNLSATDAASVTQHLKDDKVSYRLSSDGKTIYVPSQNISDERVAIAGSNVIKGGSTGYELFDRTNFGMTEFEEKVDKTRAVEGELERTIEGLRSGGRRARARRPAGSIALQQHGE